jgi:hypothetical protein
MAEENNFDDIPPPPTWNQIRDLTNARDQARRDRLDDPDQEHIFLNPNLP